MKSSLNLLPYALRRRDLIRQRICQWCLMWAIAAAVAGIIIYWTKYVPLQACQAKLQTRERQFAPLKKLQNELEAMHAQMQDLKKREALALSLANNVPAITLLGVTSRAARQSDASVYLSQMSLDQKPLPEASDRNKASPAEERRGILTLQGAGVDNLSVARFVAALRDSGAFDTVELKSTGIEAIGRTEACSYVVECVF